MGPSPKALLTRAFEMFNRRDVDGLLELLHPEVRVHSLMTEAEGADYVGHDGVRRWQTAVLDIFPDWCPQLREIDELGGGAVLGRFAVTATGGGSGAPIDQAYWVAGQMREGRILFYGFYRTEGDAREALGLGRSGAPE